MIMNVLPIRISQTSSSARAWISIVYNPLWVHTVWNLHKGAQLDARHCNGNERRYWWSANQMAYDTRTGCFHSFYGASRQKRVISRRYWSENHTKSDSRSISVQLSNRGTVDSRGENRMNISLDRNLFLLTAGAVMAIGFYLCVAFERKMIANNWNISLDAIVDDQWFVVVLHCCASEIHMKWVPAECPVGIIFPLPEIFAFVFVAK